MSYILKEIFGDTKRVRILEELIERAGELLSVSEISRMSEVSTKTVYNHLYQLEEMGIILSQPGRIAKYGLNMDDSRAIALSIISDEEYLRKINLSIRSIEIEEINEKVSKNIESSVQGTKPYFRGFNISFNNILPGLYNLKTRNDSNE